MTAVLASVAAAIILALVAAQAAHLARTRPPAPAPPPAPAAPAPTGSRNPLEWVVAQLRQRRWARRSLSGLSVVIMIVAVWIIGYPFYTNLVQSRLQAKLDRQLATPELEEAYRERRVGEGDSLTRLRIPRLNVDVVVVEGTTPTSLRAGAGHYASTPLPCEQGNMAIAGHRTTYGRPFANVDLLQPGDLILLDTPIGSCTYEVNRNPFVTTPTDLTVIENTPDATLTLTTCHPKGSARQRLIVTATLNAGESQPS